MRPAIPTSPRPRGVLGDRSLHGVRSSATLPATTLAPTNTTHRPNNAQSPTLPRPVRGKENSSIASNHHDHSQTNSGSKGTTTSTPVKTLAVLPHETNTITEPTTLIVPKDSARRISVSPRRASGPAPSFRYSFRSSYRPYEFNPNASVDTGAGTAVGRIRDTEIVIDDAVEEEDEHPAPRLSARGHLRSRSKTPSKDFSNSDTSTSSVGHPPLLHGSTMTSSFSSLVHALPYYQSPTSKLQTPKTPTARTLNLHQYSGRSLRSSPIGEHDRVQISDVELGISSVDSDNTFHTFVGSAAYANCEAAVTNNIDLLRRSNALNEDSADYCLVLESDAVDNVDPNASNGNGDMEMDAYIAAIEQAYDRQRRQRANNHHYNHAMNANTASPSVNNGGTPGSNVSGNKRRLLTLGLGRTLPLPELPALTFSEISRKFSSRCILEQGKTNSEVIIEKLRNSGLDVVVDPLSLKGRKLLRVSASAQRLELEAERMRLRMPVNSGGYRTFDRTIRHEFIGTGDSYSLFRSSERQTIIDHIIRSKIEEGGAGLDSKYESMIADRFPLHMYARVAAMTPWVQFWKWRQQDRDASDSSGAGNSDKKRSWFRCPHILYSLFAQPLDAIRGYFGERISFYFAFLGFYTAWLIAPTLFGVALFFSQLTHTSLDSPFIPFFSLLMALWASLFIESWKRRQSSLAIQWGTYQYEANDEEVTRPEYIGQLQTNPVNQQLVRIYPMKLRIKKLLLTVLLCFVLIAGFSTMILKIFMQQDAYFGVNTDRSTTDLSSFFTLSTLFVPIVWGFLIPVSEILFNVFALKLTNWENWRTDNLFYSQLTLKIFSFRFLNSFLALYYYAFSDLGIVRLSQSVASFLVIGSGLRFTIYNIFPYMYKRVRARLTRRSGKQALIDYEISNYQQHGNVSAKKSSRRHRPVTELSHSWYERHDLVYDTFEDYCNLIIQFGYVSFFTVAFPLAPLCALVTNIVEIRAGAYKLLNVYRRPRALKSSGIGVWLSVLQCMSIIAVLTNCALIGFTSSQINNWFPNVSNGTKILIIFVFEHIIIACKFIIHNLPFGSSKAVKAEEQRLKHEHSVFHGKMMELKRMEQERDDLIEAERDARKQELHTFQG